MRQNKGKVQNMEIKMEEKWIRLRNVIAEGISKINIFTDLCIAGNQAMADGLNQGLEYLKVRNLKVDTIREVVKNKIRLFGSVGKK